MIKLVESLAGLALYLAERVGGVLEALLGVVNEVVVGTRDEVAGGVLDCERLRLSTATIKATIATTVERAVRMATPRWSRRLLTVPARLLVAPRRSRSCRSLSRICCARCC
jgi:hypothetical protein